MITFFNQESEENTCETVIVFQSQKYKQLILLLQLHAVTIQLYALPKDKLFLVFNTKLS